MDDWVDTEVMENAKYDISMKDLWNIVQLYDPKDNWISPQLSSIVCQFIRDYRDHYFGEKN